MCGSQNRNSLLHFRRGSLVEVQFRVFNSVSDVFLIFINRELREKSFSLFVRTNGIIRRWVHPICNNLSFITHKWPFCLMRCDTLTIITLTIYGQGFKFHYVVRRTLLSIYISIAFSFLTAAHSSWLSHWLSFSLALQYQSPAILDCKPNLFLQASEMFLFPLASWCPMDSSAFLKLLSISLSQQPGLPYP